jgi:hypothetical protein
MDITAFCSYGADMHQAVAPSLLRGVDHLFADWTRGHFGQPSAWALLGKTEVERP